MEYEYIHALKKNRHTPHTAGGVAGRNGFGTDHGGDRRGGCGSHWHCGGGAGGKPGPPALAGPPGPPQVRDGDLHAGSTLSGAQVLKCSMAQPHVVDLDTTAPSTDGFLHSVAAVGFFGVFLFCAVQAFLAPRKTFCSQDMPEPRAKAS